MEYVSSFNESFEKKSFKSSSCHGIKKPLIQNYTCKKISSEISFKTILQDLHEDIALITTLKHKDVNSFHNLERLFKVTFKMQIIKL